MKFFAGFFLLGFAFAAANNAPPLIRLERLNVNPDTVTISGFSSGGGLSQELFVSYPSLFKGIGVFQQTFYRCGKGDGDVHDFDKRCTSLLNVTEASNPQDSINDIHSYFAKGLIEDPKLLENKRLYVYAGLRNFIFIKPELMLNIIKVFEPFIKNPYTIRTRIQDSGYLFPTDNFGNPCNESANDYYGLGNCKLNGAYDALSFLLGEDQIRLPNANDKANLDSLKQFDQTEFTSTVTDKHFMAQSGFIYIPKRCEGNGQRCHFHIYFHGCGNGADFNEGKHILKGGYLELAEKNNLIILFPQIQKDAVNFLGCWDSFGITGPLYATQKGVQVDIMRRILQRVVPQGQGNTGRGSRSFRT